MRKKARCLIPCFLCLRARAEGEGRGRADPPTRPTDPSRPDPPTRPTDPTTRPDPTPKGRCRRCKRMQAECEGKAQPECEGNASGMRAECNRKSKGGEGRGEGSKGQGGATEPKAQKSISAKTPLTTLDHL